MRFPLRRIEFGAGLAAALLSVSALLLLLFTPLIAYCAVSTAPGGATTGVCPAQKTRYTSLLHVGVSGPTWAFLLGMLVVTLAGAVGAMGEARFGWRWGAFALWIGALLAFGGCALALRGVGALYLPTILALLLAAYVSILQRRRARSSVPSA